MTTIPKSKTNLNLTGPVDKAEVSNTYPKRGSVKLLNTNPDSVNCTCPSGCKKNYCVCLKAGTPCNSKCVCTSCENDLREEAAFRRRGQ